MSLPTEILFEMSTKVWQDCKNVFTIKWNCFL